MAMASMSASPAPEVIDAGFSVSHQKVDLDLDLLSRSLTGRTEITLNALAADSKLIKLNLRQCNIDCVLINGQRCSFLDYDDCYKRAKLHYRAGVHQYHQLRDVLPKPHKDRNQSELVIGMPRNFRLQELDPYSEETQSLLLAKALGSIKRGAETSAAELAQGPTMTMDPSATFAPITLYVEFSIDRIRDGMHFIGLEERDLRYPHAYSSNSAGPEGTRCLFPCADTVNSRCTWEINVKTARTIGDIFGKAQKATLPNGLSRLTNGSHVPKALGEDIGATFTAEDRAMELVVLSSGELTDETVDSKEPGKKTTSFVCSKEISAKHVGFVVGAFEEVDLSIFRASDEDDRLGQSAVPVQAFCTMGRAEEVKNTCFPIIQAIDYNVIPFGSFPYTHYKMCFVDDCPSDVLHTSTLSLCSSSLLFSADLLDPIDNVTRTLVHALATQWFGIDIIPQSPEDSWVIYGLAYFMTDAFLKTLFGRNEYRYRQKVAVDKVVELDKERPSLLDLGNFLDLDPSQEAFMTLKAPLVLFILDQRILKSGNAAGVSRIINRILLNAKTGQIQDNALSTAGFIKLCEKLSHLELEQFFAQWVFGSGCPRFSITPRFNKKKLVVEMAIKQIQQVSHQDKPLDPSNFIRDMREDEHSVYAGQVPACFTGPMTIRIHEADGTPYEHIVQISQPVQHIEVPYNTKYKRIRRRRKEKERGTKDEDADYDGDEAGEALLSCLGDILQSEAEMKAWKFLDWPPEEEAKMANESYEWIRVDADFEWICKMQVFMPGYMYISQLQQDRDVVAQYESVQYLSSTDNGNRLISTFLTRTLMDRRYFYGVRMAAAAALSTHTSERSDYVALFHLGKIFEELYCQPDTAMVRPNDFSDRAAYLIQCAIVKAFGDARDGQQRSPFQARRWILDKLKYNDNSQNEFSEAHYIALLMDALASAISSRRPFHEVEDLEDPGDDNIQFHNACLDELERYRRSDEWTASYSNIVSRAAINCRAKLIRSRFLKFNPIDFLQYTSDLASPLLRTEALTHLLTISQVKHPQLLRYYLFALGTDPSSAVREALLQHFGLILSRIAIGTDAPATTLNPETKVGDLVVETDVTTEEHKAESNRKTSIAGALDALKLELGPNVALQEGLWSAITSPVISLTQMQQLLDFCAKLYIPRSCCMVVFKMPRYWSVSKTGKGKLKFVQDGAVRQKPLLKKETPKPALKLNFSKLTGGPNGVAGGSPLTPSTPASASIIRRESASGIPKLVFKGKPQAPPPPPPPERVSSTGSIRSDSAEPKKKLTLKFGALKSGSPG